MNSKNQSKTVTVLSDPINHSLQKCFKELKFGRPAKEQKFLDFCVLIMDDYEKIGNKIAESIFIFIQKHKFNWSLEKLEKHINKTLKYFSPNE